MEHSAKGSIFSRRGGFALLGVGPSLLLWLVVMGGSTVVTPSAALTLSAASAAEIRGLAFPDQFPLFPTQGNEGASGMAYLKQPWSPYGVSVDEDGNVQYELQVEVAGLPAVDGEVYRVWVTTPKLAPVALFGTLAADGEIRGSNDFHQLMVVVSREPADRIVEESARWSGPIVLRGFSAGARVTPMAQHSLFQQTPM